MTLVPNKKFGASLGPSKPLGESAFDLKLNFSAMKSSIGSGELEDFDLSENLGWRLTNGGLAAPLMPAVLGSIYAGAEPRQIVHLATYVKKSGTTRLIRIHPTIIGRWDGATWLTVPGTRTANPFIGAYSLVSQDKFVYANGITRLTAWDGVDANAQADLSADAPIARYITKIGNRILAAGITVGGVYDPFLVAWSADGDITDWTNALNGAGADRPPIEGPTDTSQFITGLSSMVRGTIIYRQNAVQLASLTGIGAAPFRFSTIKFANGTESPYSIASGSMMEGDFYFGSDFMVYFFDGDKAVPIGDPVFERILSSIGGPINECFGFIDRTEQEYILVPSGGANTTFRFNIREFVTTGKLKWRQIDANIISGVLTSGRHGFANAAINRNQLVLGNNLGQVLVTGFAPLGNVAKATTKSFLFGGNEITLSRLRVFYRGAGSGTVSIQVTNELGSSVTAQFVLPLASTPNLDQEKLGEINLTGRTLQFQISHVSGDLTITGLEAKIQNRGLGNA